MQHLIAPTSYVDYRTGNVNIEYVSSGYRFLLDAKGNSKYSGFSLDNNYFDGVMDVQVAFYGGYFAMAFPAAMFIRRYSYKAGVLVGTSFAMRQCISSGDFSKMFPKESFTAYLFTQTLAASSSP